MYYRHPDNIWLFKGLLRKQQFRVEKEEKYNHRTQSYILDVFSSVKNRVSKWCTCILKCRLKNFDSDSDLKPSFVRICAYSLTLHSIIKK